MIETILRRDDDGRLVREDYETPGEFMECLNRTTLPHKKIIEIIRHEEAHFEKAKELGYTPSYSIHVLHDGEKGSAIHKIGVFAGLIYIPEKDDCKILMAPLAKGILPSRLDFSKYFKIKLNQWKKKFK